MNKGSRIALIVTGSIASLLATALVAGGALALWGDSQKGSDGSAHVPSPQNLGLRSVQADRAWSATIKTLIANLMDPLSISPAKSCVLSYDPTRATSRVTSSTNAALWCRSNSVHVEKVVGSVTRSTKILP